MGTDPTPGKSDELIERQREPLNLETPPAALVRDRLTPREVFYVRSHGEQPSIEADGYRLSVGGRVAEQLSLSLEELTTRFDAATVEATLSCAGNRREQLAEVAKIPGELIWGDGAIGNATWTGTRLGDVLDAAGVDRGAGGLHVAFEALDVAAGEDGRITYGGSIPLSKALAGECILAQRMNGEALSGPHGAPLRVVVPGYIGARSVKWLTRMVVQDRPSDNHFQARSYRLLPPGMAPDRIDWEQGFMLGEVSTNSAICRPAPGEQVAAGAVTVSGWALAGGERTVERVDVSVDGGRNWLQAELRHGVDPWSWSLWAAEVELDLGGAEIVVRAVDSAANAQPEDPAPLWNAKGYANNAWHRVRIEVTGGGRQGVG